MKPAKTLQIANLLGLTLVLVINTLAITLPIAGNTTGAISDLYPNLFVPAGYAFSIWSLIYILLLGFIIRQSKGLFSSNTQAPQYVEKISWWFLISCLANSSWIIAWHYLLPGLSVLVMLLILFSLIRIYQLLDINYFQNSNPILIRATFSVYLGWISVATIANITAFLVSKDWSGGLTEVTWTVLMLGVATFLGLIFIWKNKDWLYAAVLVWAFWAIRVKRIAAGNSDESIIITIIYIFISLLILTTIGRLFLGKKQEA